MRQFVLGAEGRVYALPDAVGSITPIAELDEFPQLQDGRGKALPAVTMVYRILEMTVVHNPIPLAAVVPLAGGQPTWRMPTARSSTQNAQFPDGPGSPRA